MNQKMIFYGAGECAKHNIENWLSIGLEPLCFADTDECKHYTYIPSSVEGGGVKILPLKEAVSCYPEAKIMITTSRWPYTIYKFLLSEGVTEDKIYKVGAPKYCDKIGKEFIIHGPGVQTCCERHSSCVPPLGNIKDDVNQYKRYCEELKAVLKIGLATACTGCYRLKDGVSSSDETITSVNISSGLPGGERCNFKCSYCTYGEGLSEYSYENNVLEILEYLDETVKPLRITYACGEITVSPFRDEILTMWLSRKWKGEILTNGLLYNEKIAVCYLRN